LRLGQDALLAGVLAAPLLVAAALPVAGPLRLQLNLGPGDAPYVAGFSRYSEVENTVGVHWAGPDARMALPLQVDGPLRLSLRFSRVLAQEADVAIAFAGRPVDRVACRGGRVLERAADVAAQGWPDAAVEIRVSQADAQGRALRLDWLRLDLAAGARARLHGVALVRPALLVLVLFGLLRLAGLPAAASVGLCLPWCLVGGVLLRTDPWLLHRLLTWLPECLALLGVALLGACRCLVGRGLLQRTDTRLVVAVATAAFVLRGGALNHPDYWYPDLHSHSTLAEVVRGAGLDFLRRPASYIREQGVWVHLVYGKQYAMPYSPAFHAAFALLPIGRDATVTAMKLAAAACSTLPMLGLALLARQWGASPAGVVLLGIIPIYGMRLALALLAAMFGHAVDSLALAWLARRFRGLADARTLVAGAAGAAACCLAYVSAAIVLPLFLGLLAAFALVEGRRDRVALAARVLGIGAVGGALAFAVYYRGFSELVVDMVGRVATGSTGGSARQLEAVTQVLWNRTLIFMGPIVPWLALAGLPRLLRAADNRPFVAAWSCAYLALIVGRARLPDVFGHVHEVLFVAPLVCLAAGDALARLARRGPAFRALAIALVLAIAALGLQAQWRLFVEQFGWAL
jgi:hypothetical protein